MLNYFHDFIKKIDFILLFCLVSISIFGLLTMSSFSLGDSYTIKQSAWICLGILSFLFFSRLEFDFLKDTKAVMFAYLFSNLLLLATLFFGSTIKGSKAWISFGGISLQPADFAKLALIILIAKYFSRRHIEIKNIRHIVVSFIYVLLPVFLTLLQPDFGSAMVLLMIWFIMVMMSGLSKKHFFSMCGAGVILVFMLWVSVFKPYQKDRLLNFFDPGRDIRGSGYNVYQSQMAIGSGGLLGKGVGFGTQSRLNFLPEHETDFIFSAYAEEWGFVGVSMLLSLYFVLLSRLVFVASNVNDNFFALVSLGIFSWFFVHIFVNVGMNLGVLPVTGIPLPFMSYGGSSFLSGSIALGIIASFSVNKFKQRKNYKNEFLGFE
jgi:rod shape determining protein RodA